MTDKHTAASVRARMEPFLEDVAEMVKGLREKGLTSVEASATTGAYYGNLVSRMSKDQQEEDYKPPPWIVKPWVEFDRKRKIDRRREPAGYPVAEQKEDS